MGKPATREQVRVKLRQVNTRRAAGETVAEACRVAGISPSTYRRWQKRLPVPSAKKRRAADITLNARETPRPITTIPPREPPSRVQTIFKWAGRVIRAISFTGSLNEALQDQIAGTIEAVVARIPDTREHKREDAETRCDSIIKTAAARAAASAGGFALPLGPLAILFILPDLAVVWKIQMQMVADIAGVFGKRHALTREQMLYCLFKHAAGRTIRSVAVRTGKRVLIKGGSLHLLRRLISRLTLPVIGAVAGGVYAYYDTAQVGKTAIESFKPAEGQMAGNKRL